MQLPPAASRALGGAVLVCGGAAAATAAQRRRRRERAAAAVAFAPSPAPLEKARASGGAVTREELGRCTWTLLHTLAAQYAEQPTKQQQRDARELILILTRLYPCRECAVHFAELVSADPPTVATRAELSQWLCRTHNKVSARLGKPAFNCARVGARWGLVTCKDDACTTEALPGQAEESARKRVPQMLAAQKLQELRQAVQDLQERGLLHAAKWAAEHAVALQATAGAAALAPGRGASEPVDDVYALAKTQFDLKEYLRAAHTLRGASGSKARFLRCYALYLAGEKRKTEELVEVAGPMGRSNDVVNQELPQLEVELAPLFDKGQLCPFEAYVYGLVLVERERKAEARVALVFAANGYPCNWSAWLALQNLCPDAATAAGLSLKPHWMRDFFEASMALELHDNAAAQTLYQRLAADFPTSGYVATQSATAQYGLRAFDAAASAFESIARAEPFRLEGMDTYSNILYVKEATAALSGLAHDAVATDKYRPETCCIVGNYYSLKGAHDKAVLYFRRALKLNPAYLSAWTLMGHEYVEMKNLGAAVEAYRAAVALSPRDYRAWYGLGQTYELLGLPLYALHYYGRAAALRPGDARMWCAIGQCYESEQLGRADAAVRCYRRALANDDREGIALAKLAKLHANMGQREEAAHFHRLNLQRLDDEHAEGAELIEALQFLAQYAKESGSLQEAEKYCTRLLDFGGPAKEAAKGLLREIRTAAMGAMEISPSS